MVREERRKEERRCGGGRGRGEKEERGGERREGGGEEEGNREGEERWEHTTTNLPNTAHTLLTSMMIMTGTLKAQMKYVSYRNQQLREGGRYVSLNESDASESIT